MTCCGAFETATAAGAIEEINGRWWFGRGVVETCPFCMAALASRQPPTVAVMQGGGDVLVAIQSWTRLRGSIATHPRWRPDCVAIMAEDGELDWVLPDDDQ